MSKIAQALAKAKERTGNTTAPFMGGGGAAASLPKLAAQKEAALKKARRLQRFWLVLSSIALVLTGFILWARLGEPEKKEEAAPRVPAAANTAKAPVAEPGSSVVAPLAGVSKVELVEPPVPVILPTEESVAVAPTPKLELQAEVNALVFSAVMPGERPRLMYKGRIITVGGRVEGELIFAGIHDGRLVFNDAQGAIYLRRY